MSNPRVDMLARTVGGVLCNLELQSSNSGDMAQRQAEYYLDLHGLCGVHVRQVVLYVGQKPVTMRREFATPSMRFQYELVDVREERFGRGVWPEIERMEAARREDAVTKFLIISGSRNLEGWFWRRLEDLCHFPLMSF